MNNETGKIEMFEDGVIPEGFTEIFTGQMTEKQRTDMQVSEYDNKSELGKIFTGCRADRRREERLFNKAIKKRNKQQVNNTAKSKRH